MLLYASEFGHEESVRALIEKGASLEAVDKVRHFHLQTSQACNNLILFSYYFFPPPKVTIFSFRQSLFLSPNTIQTHT